MCQLACNSPFHLLLKCKVLLRRYQTRITLFMGGGTLKVPKIQSQNQDKDPPKIQNSIKELCNCNEYKLIIQLKSVCKIVK